MWGWEDLKGQQQGCGAFGGFAKLTSGIPRSCATRKEHASVGWTGGRASDDGSQQRAHALTRHCASTLLTMCTDPRDRQKTEVWGCTEVSPGHLFWEKRALSSLEILNNPH